MGSETPRRYDRFLVGKATTRGGGDHYEDAATHARLGLLVLAGSVEAATLFSASLSAGTGLVMPLPYRFVCRIVNVSNKAREVTLEIVYALDGTVLTSFTDTVEPGTGTSANSAAATFLAGAYCKANVTGSKADWRGTFNVEETVGLVNVLTIATTPLE